MVLGPVSTRVNDCNRGQCRRILREEAVCGGWSLIAPIGAVPLTGPARGGMLKKSDWQVGRRSYDRAHE